MKDFKELSWQVDEPTYRQFSAISYSALSRFKSEGLEHIDGLYDKLSTPSLTFGSLVDTLVTEGKEIFDTKYAVFDLNPKPSDTIQAIVTDLYKEYGDNTNNIENHFEHLEDIPEILISDVAINNNYFVGASYNKTRSKKVIDQGSQFYEYLKLAKDRKIISREDYNDAFNCYNTLITNPITKDFFTSTKDKKIYFQLKFKENINFGPYNNIAIKCMPDLLIVDYTNKTIQPVDLKTSSRPEYLFVESFYKYNYYIQAGLYTAILIDTIKNSDTEYKDFKVLPYKFMVINRKTLNPMIWDFTPNLNNGNIDSDIVDIYEGFEDIIINGYKFKAWKVILLDLYYALNINSKMPRKVCTNISEYLKNK